MKYLDALKRAHEILHPELYFEIGCRHGMSLSLSKCRSIAVDPEFEITQELSAPTQIFCQKSDEFFLRGDLLEILDTPIDMAFIDGMHQVDAALRDFINLEMYSCPSSVIFIDDILPADIAWTTRERMGRYWTGDVYRLIPILRQFRPDLTVKVFDIEEKGLAVVSNLDAGNAVLTSLLPEIEKQIAAGFGCCASIEEVRKQADPVNSEMLSTHLIELTGDTGRKPSAVVDDLTTAGYLELVKKCVLNEIYISDELRIYYLKKCILGTEKYEYAKLHDIEAFFPKEYQELLCSRKNGYFPNRNIANSGFSHTMMGRQRLDSLHHCLNLVHANQIFGDLIECGVWRGGGCILMAAFLRAHEIANRRVFVADSFEGLPGPQTLEDENLDLSSTRFPELAVSLDAVQENFRRYGLAGPDIVFLKGWFKDTLPVAPIDKIALLRLDGDLYSSTTDCLVSLYDKVETGGIVIVDDWGALPQCRRAVEDFFAARSEKVPEMNQIDWTGVYWVKTT